jgi:gamma-glutamyltranspeptidase/glutathione hydrolase
MASRFVASTNHYLATMAAVRILEAGGNAVDAGVAAGLCINVVQPDMTNLGGVAPIILYDAKSDDVVSISGVGSWPAAASIDFFMREYDGVIQRGIHCVVLPAAVDCWLTALERYGTMTLGEVAASAIELADRGFPVNHFLAANLESVVEKISGWPSTAEIFLSRGRAPKFGERLVQRDLANTLRMLVEAETGASHISREAGIRAARDRFYTGDIAERVARFYEEQGGFLTLDDLKQFHVDVEQPVKARYRGYDIYGCQPWCQGPTALAALSILDGYDLASLGQGSADSFHLILEALKAAFSDREHYYGDPKFVDVPVAGLMNPDYAATWRERIKTDTAFPDMPEPGDPWAFQAAPSGALRRPYTPPQP